MWSCWGVVLAAKIPAFGGSGLRVHNFWLLEWQIHFNGWSPSRYCILLWELFGEKAESGDIGCWLNLFLYTRSCQISWVLITSSWLVIAHVCLTQASELLNLWILSWSAECSRDLPRLELWRPRICANLGYPWMQEASRIAGSRSEVQCHPRQNCYCSVGSHAWLALWEDLGPQSLISYNQILTF